MNSKIKQRFNYEGYIEFVNNLIENSQTSGETQTEDLIKYTKLNGNRMKRVTKQFNPSEEFKNILKNYKTPMIWTVITEAWCGDAAQNIPAIAKIVELLPNTNLEIILRDENLDLIDQHLTNGGRSIPKLIAKNSENNDLLFEWGARPTDIQQFVLDYKKSNPEFNKENFNKELHLLYSKNRGQALINDFKNILS